MSTASKHRLLQTRGPTLTRRLAYMISQVEAMQSWLENVTYQMCQMTYSEYQVMEHICGAGNLEAAISLGLYPALPRPLHCMSASP